MAIGIKSEGITHVNAIRMRLKGSGVMHMELNSLDDIKIKELVGFQMSLATNIEPTRLTNFSEQRIRLHGYVDEINERFSVSSIIFFVKESYRSRPSQFDALPE